MLDRVTEGKFIAGREEGGRVGNAARARLVSGATLISTWKRIN